MCIFKVNVEKYLTMLYGIISKSDLLMYVLVYGIKILTL